MQPASQLVNIYVTLIRNFGIFADDGEPVRDQVQSTVQDAIRHMHLTTVEAAVQIVEEFRAALVMILNAFQPKRRGSIEVFRLAISLLPHAS